MNKKITNISILGSTGSIGTQTLDVISEHQNSFSSKGLAAGVNIELLLNQINQFSPSLVSVSSESLAIKLKKLVKSQTEVMWGEAGNLAVATLSDSNRVVIASPGLPGIRPTLEAIRAGKTIALATKEVLVAAGEVIIKEAIKKEVPILPVDSEHSAIFQCLEGRSTDEVSRIFLTCSGGPFRGLKAKDLKKVTREQALNHPSWKMGRKITIDSSTLMNKGFEVIEAHHLFGIPLEKIKVIVHPQSVIHSAVEFIDGTIMAQIGPADMRLPIQHALFYPEKRQTNKFKRFSFDDYPNLSFEHPDKETFRCLQLAYDAGITGGSLPVVLNAANDVTVAAFLNGQLPFYKIPEILEKALESHKLERNLNLDKILEVDARAREFTLNLIESLS